jgi:hypothetical protein
MFVAPAGSGNGSETNPFGSVQQAIDNAVAGDTITVLAGTYFEVLHSARNGAPGLRITLRAQTGAEVVIQLPVGALANARVLDVQHAYMTVEGIIFDGRYAGPQSDVIRVRSSGDFFTLRHSEVRNSGNNCLNLDTDAGAPIDGVIIENSLIHHCLNSTNERPDGHSDAHGISAGAVRGLIIRDTEIHTFSGDAVQFDADRDLPGWTDVLIERCRFWLQPLPEAVNNFAAGVVPGENAIDTKINPAVRAKLTLRDLTVYGFANSALNNGNIEAL